MSLIIIRLITQPPSNKQLCFRISSGIATQETPDEKALLGKDWPVQRVFRNTNIFSGFAQLSIVE